MVRTAAEFVTSDSFIDSPGAIPQAYLDFTVAVQALMDGDFWTGAGQAFSDIFNADPTAVTETPAFIKLYSRTSNSIVAATIDPSVTPKVRALLSTTAHALWLVRRLAASAKLSRTVFLSAPLALPPGIFPLPPAGIVFSEQRRAAAADRKEKVEARSQRLAELSADLTAHREAVDELLTTFDQAGAQAMGNGRSAVSFAVPDAAAARLTEATKGVCPPAGWAAPGSTSREPWACWRSGRPPSRPPCMPTRAP